MRGKTDGGSSASAPNTKNSPLVSSGNEFAFENNSWCLLAGFSIFHTVVIAIEKLSIKKLHSYHSKDEVKEEVHDQNVEDVFQRIYHTVKHCFEFWYPLDGLQWSKNSQNPKRFYHTKIFSSWTSSGKIVHRLPFSSNLHDFLMVLTSYP